MRCNTKLTKEEAVRYSRQIRLAEIGKEGQHKIKGASVVVIGAGALGCACLQYLTAAGVGTLGIVDNDWVDRSNLNRQVLYSSKDIGKPKPLAAKNRLKLLNPKITLNIHFLRLDKESSLKIISDYDIVADCTDNYASRYLINDSCVILNKPLVYGAIHKFSGQLMVLNYKGGPTLRCLFPEMPHPLDVPSCEEFGVLGCVPGIIGSLQATEVIKIILDLDGVLSGKLFMLDTLNLNSWVSSFEKNPDLNTITELGQYEDPSLCDNLSVKEISAKDLEIMLKKNPSIPVIDLRDKDDKEDIGFKTITIPYYDVRSRVRRFSEKEAVVFYCRSGSKSITVINYLQKVYKMDNLYNLVI